MPEFVVPAILVTLFTVWLIAELCWKRWVRIALGCANIIVLASFLAGATFTKGLLESMLHLCLTQIECSIKKGRVVDVQRALNEYFKTYEKTESAKAAVFKLHWALSEQVHSSAGRPEGE